VASWTNEMSTRAAVPEISNLLGFEVTQCWWTVLCHLGSAEVSNPRSCVLKDHSD